MSALGITAVQVNSAVSVDVRRARGKIGRRTVEFVFTTPEQLARPNCVYLCGARSWTCW